MQACWHAGVDVHAYMRALGWYLYSLVAAEQPNKQPSDKTTNRQTNKQPCYLHRSTACLDTRWHDRMNVWMYACLHGCMNDRMFGCTLIFVVVWTNERTNERLGVRLSSWLHERTNERLGVRSSMLVCQHAYMFGCSLSLWKLHILPSPLTLKQLLRHSPPWPRFISLRRPIRECPIVGWFVFVMSSSFWWSGPCG